MLVNNEGHIKLTDFGLSHIALLEDVTSNTNYPRKQSEASDTKSGSPSSNNPSPAGGGDTCESPPCESLVDRISALWARPIIW